MEGLSYGTRSGGLESFGRERREPDDEIFEFAEETMEEEEEETTKSNLTAGLWRSDEEDDEETWVKSRKKEKKQVFLEGYVEAADELDLKRGKSLTGEDLDELKGCLDLGFGFSYEEIPELCNTLPALELCYSMSQRFLDDHQKSADSSPSSTEMCSSPSGPIANWKISSPGDHPEDVKARLRYWAQAVACTVKLCN
ncbi:uncharacterized protein LOC127812288 [Diospyros lotus]|uniref:uncharacterized protein LOC127812288 n=1 Tax=Diospyros lotus TaxID=55363 RepID=UPI00225BA2AB|nr:uncharacterized protein LOC127812288 [Diospyros lotus]